jgi:thiol-disulfide isomerase/thioredoxin
MSFKTVLALLLFCIIGCSSHTSPDQSSWTGDSIPLIDAKDLNQLLDQNRGKVVLVDFWATWCPGCLKLFPHTVELYKRLSDKGLMVVGISLDDQSDRVSVKSFLSMTNPAFPNYISRFGTSSQSVDTFNIEGGLPYLRLYDRQGKVLQSFGGDKPILTLDIDDAVEEALTRE